MTTRIKYTTECDVCGRPLQSMAHVHIPGAVIPEPAKTSYHFRFDTCTPCEEELLKAKAVLVDVMTMKRGQEPDEPSEAKAAEFTRNQWQYMEAQEKQRMAMEQMSNINHPLTGGILPSLNIPTLQQAQQYLAAKQAQNQMYDNAAFSGTAVVPLKTGKPK